jgi:RNA polymerase-binding transcription factor DksA
VISDKKSEKIARLISLVINKLEPAKILDEGSRLWDSLVEMKKNGDVFTHNELKNLKKIGRVLSDLKTKNPQYLNSSAETIEINCSKCKKSIKTLKQFNNEGEKILCGDCLSNSKHFRKKNDAPKNENENFSCTECYKKLKRGAKSLYFDAENFCSPYCEYKTRVKKEKEIIDQRNNLIANFKETQKKQKIYRRKLLAKKTTKAKDHEIRKLIDICQICKLSIEDAMLEQNPKTKICIVCTNENIFPKKLCINCAKEIDAKLLKFKPNTHTCISCQTEIEKRL